MSIRVEGLTDGMYPFEPYKVYVLSTPYDAFGAGRALMDAFRDSEPMARQEIHHHISYPELVKKLLQEYATYYTEDSQHPLRLLADEKRQSYILLDAGWYGDEYIHHTPIHIDIIGNKIWIQYDDTEEGIATDLLAAGVPAHDIVLGFRPPHLRQYTEFAVA